VLTGAPMVKAKGMALGACGSGRRRNNCAQDPMASAKCFGLFLWAVLLKHPDVWAFGRYEKNGIPIEGLTYFKLSKPPRS
jgi:hypothetical protein